MFGYRRWNSAESIFAHTLPVSYVMTTFNSAQTVSASVKSVADRNFGSDDELIIVDDGSTDNTSEILHQLLGEFPFIKLRFNKVNQGAPASRNIGIDCAKHTLIFNLDSDNILVPGSVARLKQYLAHKTADIAAFGEIHFFTYDSGKITHKWLFDRGPITLADHLAGHYTPGASGNFLFTKESWLRAGKYDEFDSGLHDTWGFTLKQLAAGAKLVTMPGTHYLHRYGHVSLFVRESTKTPEASSLMATKMITPYLHMLDPQDAAYIGSDEGSRTWFDNLDRRRIRVMSGELGRSGRTASAKPIYRRIAGRLYALVKASVETTNRE